MKLPSGNFESEPLIPTNPKSKEQLEGMTILTPEQERENAEKSAIEQREKLIRMRWIIDLFENGLNDKDRTIGYHGTSLEFIEFLIQNGYLPGGTGENITEFDVQRGALHFFPVKSKFQESPIKETFPTEANVIERTISYAEMIAMTHYFLRALGFGLDNKEYEYIARTLTMRMHTDEYYDFRREFISKGIDNKTLENIIEKAGKGRGVVIALSSSLLDRYTIEEGDRGEGDLKIKFETGLSYKDICGIEPIGQQEWDFFIEMQKTLERTNEK